MFVFFRKYGTRIQFHLQHRLIQENIGLFVAGEVAIWKCFLLMKKIRPFFVSKMPKQNISLQVTANKAA